MKVRYIILICVVAILSCKKNNETIQPETRYPHEKMQKTPLPQKNTWNVEGSIFTKESSKWYMQDSLYAISFSDFDNRNSIILTFTHKPSGFGLYRVVDDPVEDDEASISEWRENSHHSSSENPTYCYVKVADTNGVLHFTATDVPLKHYTFVVDYSIGCAFYLTE